MASQTQYLIRQGLINPPKGVKDNLQYEVLCGSVMYGVSDDMSDMDIMGFCIPPKDMIWPHLRGDIPGFGKQLKRFEQYQQHHVNDPSKQREYDLTIYSIVKFFQLCMENNPNMLDSLFAPDTCVLYTTRIGQMVRDARRMFLHKGCWHKFKGYAFAQLHKARGKKPEKGSKRAQIREKYGWDVKFGYHVVRLMLEGEQILQEGDMDTQKHREHLKAIRRGDVTQAEVEQWFADKEKGMEKLYDESTLRYAPDQQAIKQLLLQCLEEHYGNLGDCIVNPDAAVQALREINAVVQRHNKLL
jgi:predicted nucleotidyltransferase